MPASLRDISSCMANNATAKTPKSSGASSRASAIPMIRVPAREMTLFRKLQPSPDRTLRPSPACGSPPASPAGDAGGGRLAAMTASLPVRGRVLPEHR